MAIHTTLHTSGYRVCHKHFEDNNFKLTTSGRPLLQNDAIPTLTIRVQTLEDHSYVDWISILDTGMYYIP